MTTPHTVDYLAAEKDQHDVGVTTLAVEKEDIDSVENIIRAENEFTPEEYKRLMRKVDWCVYEMLSLTTAFFCPC